MSMVNNNLWLRATVQRRFLGLVLEEDGFRSAAVCCCERLAW